MVNEKAYDVKTENVVVSTDIGGRLDLEDLQAKVVGVYAPGGFPGLVFRLIEPRSATLIFETGKMVCTGTKSPEEAREAVYKIVERMKEARFEIPRRPEVEVQNIVASADFKREIDLVDSFKFLEHTMYEPEQFPGLVYRMNEPKVVMLLFASGKAVITGAKREEDVYSAAEKLYRKLEDNGLFY